MNKQYALLIAQPAVKALDQLPLKQFKQVILKFISLQKEPKPQDCKALKGYPGGYRVDQGEFRILYTIEDETVKIFRVGKRNDSEVYRNLS
jgi:mRNA interferase RelE/StbE